MDAVGADSVGGRIAVALLRPPVVATGGPVSGRGQDTIGFVALVQDVRETVDVGC